MRVDLRVISLGAGVQSSALYLMAVEGVIGPMPHVAIFADTQSEPPHVYEQLDYLDSVGGKIIPITRPTAGSLREAVENGVNSTGQRFASVPFWVRGEDGREAPGGRQCTREYKIDVVKREIRRLLGLQKGQRAAGRFQVEEWIGISLDEAHRAKPSRYPWITSRWPLLYDYPMRRGDCIEWMKANGHPVPGKSACVFCPYRTPAEYARWKREAPELFEEACKIDDFIRSSGTMRGENGQQYIWRALKPLRDIEEDNSDQMDLFGEECEGMCGV